jgi:hypothetical protein
MYKKMTDLIKAIICAVLCSFLIMLGIVSSTAQTSPNSASNSSQQLDAKIQEIKDQVTKIGVGGDITIIGNNRREFYGSILKIEDETVSINEIDQKVIVEIKYRDIKKVRKDYGTAKNRFGNRIRPRKQIIALVIVGALLVFPIILLANSKD